MSTGFINVEELLDAARRSWDIGQVDVQELRREAERSTFERIGGEVPKAELPRVEPKPEPLPGSQFARQLISDILGMPRRAYIVGKAAVTGGAAFPTQAGFIPARRQPTPEELRAARGLALDVSLYAGAGGLGRVIGAAAKPLLPAAGRAAPMVQKAGRSALSFAKFTAVTPTEKEEAEATERVKDILEGAALGAVFPPLTRLLSPLGKLTTRIAARFKLKAPQIKEPLKEATNYFERIFTAKFSGKTPQEIAQNDLPEIVKGVEGMVGDLRAAVETRTARRAGELIEPEIEAVSATGTVREVSKPKIREFGAEVTPPETAISEEKMKGLQFAVSSLGGALRAARTRFEQTGNQAATKLLEPYESLFNLASEQFIQGRRVFGRVGKQLQRPVSREALQAFSADLARVSNGLKQLPAVAESPTVWQQIKTAVDQGRTAEAGRLLLSHFWRKNIFPVCSFIADTIGNTAKVGQQAIEGASLDVFDYILKGQGGLRTVGLVNSIARGGYLGKESRTVLSPTYLGQQYADFFSKKVDAILFPGARLKMAVDSFFKRIGFASSLYEDALTAARERGVSGAEATAFIRKLVLSPSDAMLDKATERALKFGFAEPLSRGAAATAQNPVVQLFLSPFLSFQLRFARWLAEFTPASPEFLGKLRAGNATAEDLVKYAARQVAGLGAIGLVDATLYDQIDFNTFEYVDSDTGKRTSLAGLSPLPEAIAMAAILRREPSKALAAMKRSSVTFFFSAGALSGVLNVLNNVRSGQEIPQRIADQVSLALFGWIPAQAILKSLKDMLDRTQRQGGFPEGIIGRLPVVSKTVPPRISPTTGRQLEIERTILASRIPAPEVLGRRLTQQVPEPVEREFRRLSQLGFPIQIYAPRVRLKGLELDEDVPEEIQREFERIRGLAIHKLISPVVSKAGYERLPDAKKLEILRDLRSMATSLATEHAQRAYDETYGATIEQTKAQ